MMPIQLPPAVLNAIADPVGGRVAIVVGAGCSKESPTDLPLSGECSHDVYQQLLADGVLAENDCLQPTDLGQVAEIVFQKCGSQAPLVIRLPVARFQTAEPNKGHELAAALLLEGAISTCLSLNFDLAMDHALAALSARGRVTIVYGPENHHQLATSTVVYLHRSANAPPEEWILRSSQIETAWRGSWQDLVVARVATSPVVVFVGLGSPAPVLEAAVLRMREALGAGCQVYQVDLAAFQNGGFSAALGIDAAHHVSAPWTGFMAAMGARVARAQLDLLATSAKALQEANALPVDDLTRAQAMLATGGLLDLDLLSLGRLRSKWLRYGHKYLAARETGPGGSELLADLVLGVACILRQTAANTALDIEVGVHLDVNGSRAFLVPASGRGTLAWYAIEACLPGMYDDFRHRLFGAHAIFLVAGVSGAIVPASPPKNLIADEAHGHIVNGPGPYSVLEIGRLRADAVAALTGVLLND